MTELRFHRQIYVGTAVDEAVKRFDGFADFALREEASHWVVAVTVTDDDSAAEKRVADELGNFALGLTIQKRGR